MFRLTRLRPVVTASTPKPTGKVSRQPRIVKPLFNYFPKIAEYTNMATGSKSKKIIVTCDGTWLNSDDAYVPKSYLSLAKSDVEQSRAPSNVTRIHRSIIPEPEDAPAQTVSYYAGIGSDLNFWDHFVNGATGLSIGQNIREAYTFIRGNWAEGDEIFLLGFSRGAFTARSIASYIAGVGMLNGKGMEYNYEIYSDWENLNVPDYKNMMYPDLNFSADPTARYSSYALQLQKDGLTTLDVPIKAVAVWDTVGALGIPVLSSIKPTRSYAFVDTYVPHCVENAFQALALDEQRATFSPSVWEVPDHQNRLIPCHLKQVWFPGAHSCIGGSVEDSELPCITMAWMVSQLEPYLKFDSDYLKWIKELNLEYYKSLQQPTRGWSMGYIKDPTSGDIGAMLEKLGGLQSRTPGTYTRTDPKTGRRTETRLRATNEMIHPSVRVRRALKGKGMNDKGDYNPPALKGFTLGGGDGNETDATSEGWTWSRDNEKSDEKLVITEEKLGNLEKLLLEMSSAAAES